MSNKAFTKVLCNHLKSITNKSSLILAGDFNINLIDTDNDINKLNFVNKIKPLNLEQIISAPTRITNHSRTLIDHIYLCTKRTLDMHRGILLNQIRDHLCAFVNINEKINRNNNRPLIRIMG